MAERSIYEEIAGRTNGDIYIGVVGPVRTGKSTLIQQFMEHLILPNLQSEYVRELKELGKPFAVVLNRLTGQILRLILPGEGIGAMLSGKKKIYIPFDQVDRIGDDVILVHVSTLPEKE